MEKYTMFMDRKNQYSENEYTTQSNLYIQCNSYQSAAAAAKSLQSCLTLCDPIDSSPPGSCVSGILQARILEWVAIFFSKIQCNPYQTTNSIFHRARTNNFTICMEMQKKTSNSQSNLEKEEWNWRNQPA